MGQFGGIEAVRLTRNGSECTLFKRVETVDMGHCGLWIDSCIWRTCANPSTK